MNIEEARAIYKDQHNRASQIARLNLAELHLPKEVYLPTHISNLGRKAGKIYERHLKELVEELGKELPANVGVSLHEYWFACLNGAAFFQVSIEDGDFNDNDYTRNLSTHDGYANFEGWANTLANTFADLTPGIDRIESIKELTGRDISSPNIALRCMSLYWFAQASKELEDGNVEIAFDITHEAYDSLALYMSGRTWDDAWKEATKNAEESLGSKVRSALASKAGLAAHRESHALKAEVKEFWKKNISPTIGNDAAATILIKQFPLQFRTLSKYVSEFKNTPS